MFFFKLIISVKMLYSSSLSRHVSRYPAQSSCQQDACVREQHQWLFRECGCVAWCWDITADEKEYLDREDELARLTRNCGVSVVLQERHWVGNCKFSLQLAWMWSHVSLALHYFLLRWRRWSWFVIQLCDRNVINVWRWEGLTLECVCVLGLGRSSWCLDVN